MGSVSFVLLLILVWTFTTVCEDDNFEKCAVTCEDVTGTVGKDLTLTCSVSWKCSKCCTKIYKFTETENENSKEICRQEFLDSCDQWTNFTCPYTPKVTMATKFRFCLQTQNGMRTVEFSVNITETVVPEHVSGAWKYRDMEESKQLEDHENKISVTIPLVIGFIIINASIIVLLYKKMKWNDTNSTGFQRFFCTTDMMPKANVQIA
ncbi:uncharacterized protein LOC127427355 [Myxocyprinus asiaticus]|uniref:uncharacterized protein LOC127427355 n=1 Tax=Myxocyprinus asiaticus TaxID=70543 RepID=UPI002223BB11|nr:uncharacterized protein LOC127427355 [Myxocyprinus asiaticus]